MITYNPADDGSAVKTETFENGKVIHTALTAEEYKAEMGTTEEVKPEAEPEVVPEIDTPKRGRKKLSTKENEDD